MPTWPIPLLLMTRLQLWLILIVFLCADAASVDHICSGTTFINATTTPQTLTTFNFGTANYPANMNCEYVIKADVNYRIGITIQELEMEDQLFNDCLDYVGISEGYRPQQVEYVLKMCGRAVDRRMVTIGDTATVSFVSDSLLEARGARLTFQAIPYGVCDPDWVEGPSGQCYRLVEDPKMDWYAGQEDCIRQQSNLLSITNGEEKAFVDATYGHLTSHPYIGYTDAVEEGKISPFTYDPSPDAIYPSHVDLIGNTDEHDCLYLDYTTSDSHNYGAADCRIKMKYICHKNKNWTTIIFRPQKQKLSEGRRSHAYGWVIWLFLLLLLLLLLLLCYCCCRAVWRKKSRVGDVAPQNTMASSSRRSQGGAAAPSPQPQPGPSTTVTISQPHPITTVQPLPARSENVRRIEIEPRQPPDALPDFAEELEAGARALPQPPRHSVVAGRVPVPLAPAPKEEEEPIIPPQPQPMPRKKTPSREPTEHSLNRSSRKLPPLSIRETTFHSIGTREESFMRSRRAAELFDRPKVHVLDNVSAISLDEFWSSRRPRQDSQYPNKSNQEKTSD